MVCRVAPSPLLLKLHELLQEVEVDMTLFYRGLADLDLEQAPITPLQAAFYDVEKLRAQRSAIEAWLHEYAACAPRRRTRAAHEKKRRT